MPTDMRVRVVLACLLIAQACGGGSRSPPVGDVGGDPGDLPSDLPIDQGTEADDVAHDAAAPACARQCQPCTEDPDCEVEGASGPFQCLDYGDEGSFCGMACETNSDCCDGMKCADFERPGGGKTKQCTKTNGACECSPEGRTLGMKTACAVTNEFGSCKGLRKCTGDGLSACDAPVPAAEKCDLADNDCNGKTDDVPGEACFNENENGKCEGKTACDGGKEVCVGPTPAVEDCDGKDNDCDGTADDGFADTDGDGLADCIDPDDDGDGVPDAGDDCPLAKDPEQADLDGDKVGDACDPDIDGDGFANEADCGPFDKLVHEGAPELCDGKDNDCNMLVDDVVCVDAFDCTIDWCDAGTGACMHAPEDIACDDGNQCTEDKCLLDAGCQSSNLDAVPCDDGMACTGDDTCVAGSCAGTPIVCCVDADCDDSNECTEDKCLGGKECAHDPVADATPCDADGDGCTGGDACLAGSCAAGDPVECESGPDPCQFKTCKGLGPAEYQCVTEMSGIDVPCDDGKFCTIEDHCDGKGACTGGKTNECWDQGGGQCKEATCIEGEKKCTFKDRLDGTPCNADDDGCTVADSCSAGECKAGAPPDCTGLDEGCVMGKCAGITPATYECVKAPRPQGHPCEDGLFCSVSDTCDGEGSCTAGGPRDCTKELGNPCAWGLCDEAADKCLPKPKPEGAGCDDGLACTMNDTCLSGKCTGNENACTEERVNVKGLSTFAPMVAALGQGRYVTQWVANGISDSTGGSFMRLSDRHGSRENEEVSLVAGGTRQWPAPPAVQESGNFMTLRYGNKSSCTSAYGQNPTCTFTFDAYAAKWKPDGSVAVPEKVLASYKVKGACANWCTANASITGISAKQLAFFDQTTGEEKFGVVAAFDGSDSVPVATPPNPQFREIRYVPADVNLAAGDPVVLVPAAKVAAWNLFDASVVAKPKAPGDTAPPTIDRFAVAWVDAAGSKIYLQRFERLGLPDMAQEKLVVDAGAKKVLQVRVLSRANDGTCLLLWDQDNGPPGGRDVWGLSLQSNGDPIGTAFAVNQTLSANQRLGGAASFSDGGFVVTWDDDNGDENGYSVEARIFDPAAKPLGDDMKVNSVTVGNQILPGAGVLDTGEWVVAFTDTPGVVWTRRYFKDGKPSLGSLERRANAQMAGAQTGPRAAAAGNGNVLVAWESPVAGKEGGEVLARVFDKDGVEVRPEFQVNAWYKDVQNAPAVAAGKDGFVVVWNSLGQDGSADGVYGLVLDANGEAKGAEFLVNKTTADAQRQPSLAAAGDGGFLVTWNGATKAPGSTTDIFARLFGADGGVLKDEFTVNATTANLQEHPAVAAVPGTGGFLVAWESKGAGAAGMDVWVRRLDGQGTPQGVEVKVNGTVASDQKNPSIAASTTGGFVVCWDSWGQDAANTWGVYCRLFKADMTSAGVEYRPAEVYAGDQKGGFVTYLSGGDFLVAWASAGVDNEGLAVQYRRYDPNGVALGPRIVANRAWKGDQWRPFLVPLAAGAWFAGWQSDGQDGDKGGVFFRVMPGL